MARAATAKTEKLVDYRARRDFTKTREPAGGGAAAKAPRFVVQHHLARRDHYDFRLEVDGVLKSWAVTRGPSANPKTKRLAVRVEDHPVDYASFEGTIPKGQYGGGSVQVWDRGVFEPANGDPAAAIDAGSLKIVLKGERMHGGWALVRMRGRDSGKRENWLLIKERDASAEDDDALTDRYVDSVATGRTLDQIAAGDSVAASKPKATARSSERRAANAPEFIPPMLCTLADKPPSGSGWVHEMKYDGYRLEAVLSAGKARLFTRSGLDWTERFAAIRRAVEALPAKDAIIDGEAVIFDKRGISDFGGLVEALKRGAGNIRFAVFDLLRLDGADLTKQPLAARKERLAKLVEGHSHDLVYATHIAGDGARIFRTLIDAGSEGMVSKKLDAPYQSRRSHAWLKIKGRHRDDVTIVGWQASRNGRDFASLLVARERNGKLTYAGKVGTGFDAANAKALLTRMNALSRERPPSGVAALENAPRGVNWIGPGLIAEVEMAGVTRDGMLRQAAFVGLREDRIDPAPAGGKRGKTATAGGEIPAGARLTHADKVLYPLSGYTKQDLAAYYASVAPRMLPHLEQRPVSLVRAPDGVDGQKFFQRHILKGMSKGVVAIRPRAEKEAYIAIDSLDGLMTCAQFDVLELHGWCARMENIERPDRIVFDLDPDEAIGFAEVRRAAEQIRDLLEAANLKSFPLLSGGKGIHIIAPLKPLLEWAEIETFTEGLARKLADSEPARYIAVMTKSRRKGKIFIDYLRNKKTASAIVPWSPRARPEASVAVPVTWKALQKIDSANHFTIKTALEAPADPWDDFFKLRQTIAKRTLELFAKA